MAILGGESMKTTNIIIRVTPEYKKELKKVAIENDLTLTDLVIKAINKSYDIKEVKSNDKE